MPSPHRELPPLIPSLSTSQLARQAWFRRVLIGCVAGLFIIVFAAISVFGGRAMRVEYPNAGSVLVLALPVFFAGMLSFLSPCCLPVLSAYFAVTFRARRERVLLMTVAFFLGLATTLVLLGATATAISQLIFRFLPTITLIGGFLIIGFGVMSLLGQDFGTLRLLERPSASLVGSYLYGATFALGWTACVGPILGTVLTMLATQGMAVLSGAMLSFIYALGLGAPVIVVATFFGRLGPGSRFWRIIRGRDFSLRLGGTLLQLHTTSVASGLLLITMGGLLATGQLATISQWAVQSPFTQWVLSLDTVIQRIFFGA